jgi:hypothetical protein
VIAPRWNTPYADRVRADLVQLVETPEGAERPDRERRAAGGRAVDRPRLVVTGLVAAVVVIVAVLAIRVGLDRPAPGPAASSSASTARTPQPTRAASEITAELQDAMFALLPPSARTAPALTWTDAQVQPTGGAIDTSGKTMLLAAACEGGGTVTLTVTGSHAPRPAVLHCDGLDTAGPIDLSDAGGSDPPGAVEFDVKVTSGHPRYIAKSVAIDSALVKP